MASIKFANINENGFSTYIAGLDPSYNGTIRNVLLEVFRGTGGTTAMRSIEFTLDNGITESGWVTVSQLNPGILYRVDVTISNISAYSDVFLTATQRTLEEGTPPALVPPSFEVWEKTDTTITLRYYEVDGATDYGVYVGGNHYGDFQPLYGTGYAVITGLTPNTQYKIQMDSYDSVSNTDSGLSSAIYVITLQSSKPTNWAWEYTIVSGGSFYDQVGSTVYLMRATHWNDFTTRINLFRDYKKYSIYTFTTASTSTTEVGIKNCINQAINAINGMGFSQATVSTGGEVRASILLTMRDNLNSL